MVDPYITDTLSVKVLAAKFTHTHQAGRSWHTYRRAGGLGELIVAPGGVFWISLDFVGFAAKEK